MPWPWRTRHRDARPTSERPVTPSGHTRFEHDYVERARDGTLRRRPPEPHERRRFVLTLGRPRLLRFWKREVVRRKGETSEGFERTTLVYVGERFAGEDYRRRSPLLVLGLFRRRGPRPWLGFGHLVPDLEAARAPAAAPPHRRGRVRPYLNLYAHPGLMYELYAGLTLGRSEA